MFFCFPTLLVVRAVNILDVFLMLCGIHRKIRLWKKVCEKLEKCLIWIEMNGSCCHKFLQSRFDWRVKRLLMRCCIVYLCTWTIELIVCGWSIKFTFRIVCLSLTTLFVLWCQMSWLAIHVSCILLNVSKHNACNCSHMYSLLSSRCNIYQLSTLLPQIYVWCLTWSTNSYFNVWDTLLFNVHYNVYCVTPLAAAARTKHQQGALALSVWTSEYFFSVAGRSFSSVFIYYYYYYYRLQPLIWTKS